MSVYPRTTFVPVLSHVSVVCVWCDKGHTVVRRVIYISWRKTADSPGKPFLWFFTIAHNSWKSVCVKQKRSPACVRWNWWHVQWESGWSVHLSLVVHIMQTLVFINQAKLTCPSATQISMWYSREKYVLLPPLPYSTLFPHPAITVGYFTLVKVVCMYCCPCAGLAMC